jgi:hydrogenase nickel incorporation protein HypB
MCRTCGCSPSSEAASTHEDEHHDHGTVDAHHHHQDAPALAPRMRTIEQRVLERNDRAADDTRRWLRSRRITAVNLMAGPGAGKTTLLERTIRDLGPEVDVLVIEGDQATDNDTQRIRAVGGAAIQINTGTGCHLDATTVADALARLDPPVGSLVVIENVGNLVCPALFDLGEMARAIVVSVTDGDDKALKYPHMFRAGHALLINKLDLLPYVAFDVDRCIAHARLVNARLRTYEISATRGDGLSAWYGWLGELRDTAMAAAMT